MNKFFVLCAVLCLLNINGQNNITTLNKVKDLGMGLAIGMGALAAMPDALKCVGEATPVVGDIENLIHIIKSNPKNISAIITFVEKVFNEVMGAVTPCKALSAEGKAFFSNIAHHFTNSTLRSQGLQNMIKNFATITSDVQEAVTALKSAQQETDYITAGAKFGDLVNIFVNGKDSAPTTVNELFQLTGNSTILSKIEHLLIGIVNGTGIYQQVPHVGPCIQDIMSLETEIKQLVEDIKEKSIMDAIKLIIELIKQNKDDFATCAQIKDELTTFGEDLKDCFTNKTRIQQGFSNLEGDFEEVIQSVMQTVTSFRAGEDSDFQQAGFEMGHIFHIYAHGAVKEIQQLIAVQVQQQERKFLALA